MPPRRVTLLVITQSVRYGMREGAKVAIAPLISDAPVILLCAFVLSRVSNSAPLLSVILSLFAFALLFLRDIDERW